MENEQNASKKSTVNLFIDNSTLSVLRNEAREKDTSLNGRINAILTKYVQYYKKSEEMEQQCMFPKKYFQFVVDYIDEKEHITKVTESFRLWMPTFFAAGNISLNLDNFIQYVLEGIGVNSGTVDSFTHYTDEMGYLCLVHSHRFGLKWSRILSTCLSTLINDLLKYRTECIVYPGSFVIKVLDYRS